MVGARALPSISKSGAWNGAQGHGREESTEAEVRGEEAQSVWPMRALARLSSPLRPLPHLLPATLARGDDPRRSQSKLVAVLVATASSRSLQLAVDSCELNHFQSSTSPDTRGAG